MKQRKETMIKYLWRETVIYAVCIAVSLGKQVINHSTSAERDTSLRWKIMNQIVGSE